MKNLGKLRRFFVYLRSLGISIKLPRRNLGIFPRRSLGILLRLIKLPRRSLWNFSKT